MSIETILEYCKTYKNMGKYAVYRSAKNMLDKIPLTTDEYEAAIQKITDVLEI